VHEVCRRLDGIPLALELAAARLSVLSVDQLRDRLDDRFQLLTGGRRALPRQQTLDAVVRWSYEHLSVDEQRLLQRLAVFSGDSTVEAASLSSRGKTCPSPR
jgi:predicted ATPase